jgi:hypothetical protein
LIPAIESHQESLGRTPRLVAADAGFYSAKNEALAKVKGVKRVCIPNRSSKSPERKRLQKKRWFRNGQKWRTGCEGRIRVVKRRHGLSRCRYKGAKSMIPTIDRRRGTKKYRQQRPAAMRGVTGMERWSAQGTDCFAIARPMLITQRFMPASP